MTKKQAISLFRNAAELATKLGISRSAISQWDEEGEIPREHELVIRYQLRSECFDQSGNLLPENRRPLLKTVRRRKPSPKRVA
ncbi:MAG: hypothetical protein EPN60_16985 [Nevskiaceae bacterium]|nr:MAG: hypothetical protein EPN60_16985 [Nevskiaceae bacterium]